MKKTSFPKKHARPPPTLNKKKRRRAWTPGRLCDATGTLLLFLLKALAQNVQH